MKKQIRVTCGVIEQDGKYLIVQRGENTQHALKWEFPGGKIDPGETESECMARELQEELEIKVEVLQRLNPIFREEEHLLIELIPFRCRILSGEITLVEHLQMAWIEADAPIEYDLCEGDYGIVEQLKL